MVFESEGCLQKSPDLNYFEGCGLWLNALKKCSKEPMRNVKSNSCFIYPANKSIAKVFEILVELWSTKNVTIVTH